MTSRARGFTLPELLALVLVLGLLAALVFGQFSRLVAKAHEARNIGNLRAIGGAIFALAADRQGYLWTREMIGHSSYRAFDDPLGLPQILAPYTGNATRMWINPAGRPSLFEYGNTYAWSRSENVTTKPLAAHAQNASRTVLVWDNHTMTLPSVPNVPEPASTGGPRVPSPQTTWRRFPHGPGRGTPQGGTLGWLYLDGHVEIR